MRKNLTLRYCVTQFFYCAAFSSSTFFATTYLLGRGIAPGLSGTLLAFSSLLSCLTQPLLASMADRSREFILPKIMILLCSLCTLCFALQLVPGLPLLPAGILYIMGVWCGDTMLPLVNALCVACNEAGYTINYGSARAMGSAASAIASLTLGYVIAKLGSTWMFLLFIVFEIVTIVSIAGFPKIPKTVRAQSVTAHSCTIFEFITKYRWFCVSLLGIGFLSMFHCMVENYMIAIMERLGGDSSHVGTALFIACISGAPVIFCFHIFRRHCKDTTILKISALAFLLKSLLLIFARSIGEVYLIQLMQTVTYALLCPVQVYYASAKVEISDMVKGQAFLTALSSLGNSCGSFLGGQLLGISVDAMLLAGIGMALIGVLILFVTVNKSDIKIASPL